MSVSDRLFGDAFVALTRICMTMVGPVGVHPRASICTLDNVSIATLGAADGLLVSSADVGRVVGTPVVAVGAGAAVHATAATKSAAHVHRGITPTRLREL